MATVVWTSTTAPSPLTVSPFSSSAAVTAVFVGNTKPDSTGSGTCSIAHRRIQPWNYSEYNFIETNLDTNPSSVCDYDTTPDGNSPNLSFAIDDSVGVTLQPGETETSLQLCGLSQCQDHRNTHQRQCRFSQQCSCFVAGLYH